MTNPALIARGRHLWAKSSEDGQGHSLIAHMLDVALTASILLERRGETGTTELAAELGLTRDEARRWCVVLTGLHDLGKATPVFQTKWPPGAPEEARVVRAADVPHGKSGAVLLLAWMRERGVPKRVATTLAHAIGVHHGQLMSAGFAKPYSYDPASLAVDAAPWHAWRAALCDDVEEAFGPLSVPTRKDLPTARAWMRLAGLVAVADWIGSGLPHRGVVDDVPGYLGARRSDVEDRLRDVGWPPGDRWWRLPDRPTSFASWFAAPDRPFEPRELQREMERALVRQDGSPALILLEAPMGEGKTEAAFFAMVRVASTRGAYVALPTQATSDALHARLKEFVDRNADREVGLALAHSGARIAGVAALAAEREGAESAATASAWFSSGRRELLAELGVGTVDQSLLAVLPVKHHFVRLWAMEGKVVVIDEVHAYDAYTGGLVSDLVRWLAALDATVVLMSATLPQDVRHRLVAAYQEGRGAPSCEPPATVYPRLTVVRDDGLSAETFAATRTQRVAIRSAPYAIEVLGPELVGAGKEGGAVVAVVNRVDRAQDLYSWCRDHGAQVTLLHGRFPMNVRKRLEAEVVRRFGPTSVASERNGLVIATQVVEQSLDVDFDVLFTDLAPIDLVLQRSGRMHRHASRLRPERHGVPVIHIAGLGPHAGGGPDPDALQSVYAEFLLWRSWAVLAEADHAYLPGDIDAWVQRVYGDTELPLLREFATAVHEAQRRYIETTRAQEQSAGHWSIASPHRAASEGWGGGATDDEQRAPGLARAPTRLGEPTVNAVPVMTSAAGWRLLDHGAAIEVGARRAPSDWIAVALERQVRIGRASLVGRLAKVEAPRWWTASGPLRYLVPLELHEDGSARIDADLRLDDELGLVYGRRPARERSAP